MECLLESEDEYVILCDSDVVLNIDLKKVKKFHDKMNADMTVVYAEGKKPKGQNDIMDFTLADDGKIIGVGFGDSDDCAYGLDIIIVRRELLIDLVNEAYNNGTMVNHIPTDEELEAGFATIPAVPGIQAEGGLPL